MVDQEVVLLEERIGRLEHEVKALKAIGLKTPQLVEMLAYSEAELRKLKEQQRQERPLPARLQAATHRVEKVTADEAETIKELAGHEGHVIRLRTKLAEIADQKQAAVKELEAVKAMAGAGASETVCSNFANFMQQELTKHGMQEQQVVMLMQAVWGHMQHGTMPPQPGLQAPAAAAAPGRSRRRQQRRPQPWTRSGWPTWVRHWRQRLPRSKPPRQTQRRHRLRR
jgi:hypothetical protein